MCWRIQCSALRSTDFHGTHFRFSRFLFEDSCFFFSTWLFDCFYISGSACIGVIKRNPHDIHYKFQNVEQRHAAVGVVVSFISVIKLCNELMQIEVLYTAIGFIHNFIELFVMVFPSHHCCVQHTMPSINCDCNSDTKREIYEETEQISFHFAQQNKLLHELCRDYEENSFNVM